MKVRHLIVLHERIMAHKVEDGLCKGNEADQDASSQQRYINPLPEERANPGEPFGTVVLGDKGAHKARRAHKEARDGEVNHSRWHGSRDCLSRVPGEKHPIDEVLDRPGTGAQYQGNCDDQDLSISPFSSPAISHVLHDFFGPCYKEINIRETRSYVE